MIAAKGLYSGSKIALRTAVKVGELKQRVKDDVYIANRDVQRFGKKVAKAVKLKK